MKSKCCGAEVGTDHPKYYYCTECGNHKVDVIAYSNPSSPINKRIEKILTEFANEAVLCISDGTYDYPTYSDDEALYRNMNESIKNIIRHIEQSEIRGKIDSFKAVRNVLTGSEDFRVEPGVNLKLTMGQVVALRGYLDRQIAELQSQIQEAA